MAGLSILAVGAACLAGAELAGSTHGKAESVAMGGDSPDPTPTTGPPTAPTSPSAAPHALTNLSTTPTTRSATPPPSARAAGPSASQGARKPRPAPPATTQPPVTTKSPVTTMPSATTKPPATEPDSGTRPAGGGEAEEVVRLVNVERAAAGCKALTVDADLTEAAQEYTDDMAATGNFSHTGTDGSQPQDRIETAGYTWSRSGENIAKGQADAAAVMDAWMHSPGHRANILNCGFTEIGVGVSTDGGPWWTQDFGTPS
ncbi:hypothetical protein GCM10010230_22920 [Streptomyces narbonensis]|nr:hypothetical protein GCM10010230_22920 [Streptomyces narbonensis]